MKGVFSFGIDENGKFFYESMTDRYDTEVEPTEMESEALKQIIDVTGAVHLYRRSDSYLTICNDSDNDFCRLKATPRGLLDADETGHTSRPGVFASGDVVNGARTVVEAVAHSKVVAESMHQYMQSLKEQEEAGE